MTKAKEIRPRIVERRRRFHVRSTEGYKIAKYVTQMSAARKPTKTWYVLDKLFNWQVVSAHTKRSVAFQVRDALEAGEPMPTPPWNRKGWSR